MWPAGTIGEECTDGAGVGIGTGAATGGGGGAGGASTPPPGGRSVVPPGISAGGRGTSGDDDGGDCSDGGVVRSCAETSDGTMRAEHSAASTSARAVTTPPMTPDSDMKRLSSG